MRRHHERHVGERVGWLRAAVLGANDGILSTAGLVIGVASADATRGSVLVAGVAGLVAGALSMATGEYVSVSSQSDAENAERDLERHELATDAHGEREELVNIYVGRGLDRPLAEQVADQLTAHDALGTHLRDELGLTEQQRARPLQAASASALAFSVGAALPLVAVLLSAPAHMALTVALASLVSLAVLGAIAARTGGAPMLPGALRVLAWSTLAMVATAAIGHLFGVDT
ncbi:MAG: VIT family protein [Proteobacteria bacterium]|uniref:VIT family protein n=1 Tax=Rudaea sp. TaxID=2136325 RepID=UPI0037838221|nr:VIT family protein [Pseudomonadota bacterium]